MNGGDSVPSFDEAALSGFYERLSSEDGMAVFEFRTGLADLFRRHRPASELDDYRLGRRTWKKLRDEVAPISQFLQCRRLKAGRVRFTLDSTAPDCWYWLDHPNDKTGIEVTTALGRSRYHSSKELIDKGVGRGFLGLQDDAPQEAFDNAMARGRVMISSDGALVATKEGILRCIRRKNNIRYKGFILLIHAELGILPKPRWNTIVGDLKSAAATLPFAEVHVMSSEFGPWSFQIK